MGGCCCGSSRRAESDRAPVRTYHRQNLGEHEPLSSAFEGSSPASAIVAVDTNLDTSTPDTYRAPPAPLPYDVDLTVAEDPDLKKSDIKSKTDEQQESLKVDEYESCEKGAPEDKPDEEDVCPICLEEYDEENPRSMTKCEHHFHLCCIFEWMERSDNCPVCDQITLIDEMYA
uniref:RING-type E3 ubiquitin transferase n=1 Tax=Arundo donax TaxID=35708 RepID=A0A0A9CZM7_ARUDO